jgi:MFS family permease
MNKSLKILLIADSFNIFASALLGPIYAIFVKNIGGNIISTSWSFALLPIFSGTTLFIISRFQDKVKNWKGFMIASYLLFSLSYLLYLGVNSVFELYFVQALAGLSYAIGTPAYKGFYSKKLDNDKEASQWGNLDSMTQYVTALGAITGGLIVTIYGYNYMFAFMSFLALVSAVVIYKFLPKIN